ncbi:hypothetical protein BH23CHL1_BH23CHL1_23150 [soil metagenome]
MLETDVNAPVDQLTFITEDGTETTPEDWCGETVLLVFLRWLG